MAAARTIAKIALSSAIYAIDKPYDYLIPPELQASLKVGCRVLVPFGRGNMKSEGIVLSLAQDSDSELKLKPVASVLDAEPVVDENGIKLAVWVRDQFFCTLYDAFKAMLPAGLWYSLSRVYEIPEGVSRESSFELAGESEEALLTFLWSKDRRASLDELRAAFGGEDITPALRRLTAQGIVREKTSASRGIGDKTATVASLLIDSQEAMSIARARKKAAPLQAEVLELLSIVGSVSSKDISYYTGASRGTLSAMERRGYIELSVHEVFRRPALTALSHDEEELPALNSEQGEAYRGLRSLIGSGTSSAALLQGVTGSGKTQVYMHLLKDVLELGKTAIVLVPEIALTPQLMRSFISHFGDKVALLHSALRVGERYDEWKRIKKGEARIVVGTRSAIFAPLKNLGLIVLDEEHEQTYKSENNPRYHARDVAKYRCFKDKALLLLGSATPSIETAYAAQEGVYRYFRLDQRFGESSLPNVIIADMKNELKEGNPSLISSVLYEEIEKNLIRGEQSILFINRRGNSRFLICVDCGEVPQCERCSVSLTYHSANNRLMCHYCGHSRRLEEECLRCGGSLKKVGSGTQKVEAQLREYFPGIEIVRMDTDTVGGVNTHEKLLSKFEREKIPLLLGTQMVTKGLDFDNVTLVGVLDADLSLYANHYRAEERTFSLITQVIGRAGRGDKAGRAVIQTLTPQNETIMLAAKQDYDSFYQKEILTRELKNCPPFSDVFSLTVTGILESNLIQSSLRLKERLVFAFNNSAAGLDVNILGPAPASIYKINNRFYYKIYISCKNTKNVRGLLEYVIKNFYRDKANRGISLFADINPFE